MNFFEEDFGGGVEGELEGVLDGEPAVVFGFVVEGDLGLLGAAGVV